MEQPSLSVIMACYNCEHTLTNAIDSILAQTWEDWVMICCDDGSTDGTWSILQDYRRRYPRKFLLLQNSGNRKLPYSLNHCLQHVQTELVARMDADDVSHPERFATQVAFLRAHPEYDLVGTGMAVSDGNRILTHMLQPREPRPEDMLRGPCFSHATIMTYKRVYDALGGYCLEPWAERCEDQELWSRFFVAGFRGYNLPDLLYTVLEDENTLHRRNWKNRVNTAKTLRVAFRRMGLRGPACTRRIWLQLLTYFIPGGLYKKLHAWKVARQSRDNDRTE